MYFTIAIHLFRTLHSRGKTINIVERLYVWVIEWLAVNVWMFTFELSGSCGFESFCSHLMYIILWLFLLEKPHLQGANWVLLLEKPLLGAFYLTLGNQSTPNLVRKLLIHVGFDWRVHFQWILCNPQFGRLKLKKYLIYLFSGPLSCSGGSWHFVLLNFINSKSSWQLDASMIFSSSVQFSTV